MSILLKWLGGDDTDSDMARAKSKPIDKEKVEALVAQLRLAVRDSHAFDSVYASIVDDKALSAKEIIAIASAFASATKAKNKEAALAAIAQERLRLSHAKSKANAAAKAKVW